MDTTLSKRHHEKALTIFIAQFIIPVPTSFNDFYIFVMFVGQNRQLVSTQTQAIMKSIAITNLLK